MSFNVILLEGDDLYLKVEKIRKIKNEFGEIKKGINFIEFEKAELEELLYEISMPSFGNPEKLIFVYSSNFFQKSDGDTKKLINDFDENKKNYLDITVVFIEEKKPRATNKLKKWIKDNGKIVDISKLSKDKIRNNIISYLKKHNAFMQYSDIYYFIDSVGEDMYTIINELNKIINFKEGKKKTEKERITITKEDIDNIAFKTHDAKLYEVTANLEKDNIYKALNIINNNFKDIEQSLGLISYLYKYFFDIYLCMFADRENKDPVKVIGIAPNRTFIVKNYRRMYRKFGEEKLANILEEISYIEKTSKKMNIDIILMLKSLISAVY